MVVFTVLQIVLGIAALVQLNNLCTELEGELADRGITYVFESRYLGKERIQFLPNKATPHAPSVKQHMRRKYLYEATGTVARSSVFPPIL